MLPQTVYFLNIMLKIKVVMYAIFRLNRQKHINSTNRGMYIPPFVLDDCISRKYKAHLY